MNQLPRTSLPEQLFRPSVERRAELRYAAVASAIEDGDGVRAREEMTALARAQEER